MVGFQNCPQMCWKASRPKLSRQSARGEEFIQNYFRLFFRLSKLIPPRPVGFAVNLSRLSSFEYPLALLEGHNEERSTWLWGPPPRSGVLPDLLLLLVRMFWLASCALWLDHLNPSPWSLNAKFIAGFLTLVVYRVHSKRRSRLFTFLPKRESETFQGFVAEICSGRDFWNLHRLSEA